MDSKNKKTNHKKNVSKKNKNDSLSKEDPKVSSNREKKENDNKVAIVINKSEKESENNDVNENNNQSLFISAKTQEKTNNFCDESDEYYKNKPDNFDYSYNDLDGYIADKGGEDENINNFTSNNYSSNY